MLTQGDLAQIHDSLEPWASDGEEDGPGAGDCMRHAEVASNITKCQIPAATMAIALPNAAPKLVSTGTQTLRWKSNRPTLTPRQALANQAHSIRCARPDSTVHSKPSTQPKPESASRQGHVFAGASKTQQNRQTNASSRWCQNKDPNLPDASLGSQVQHQYLHMLAASRKDMDKQLAECQHLRDNLQHQLQYIQQTLTQLDDKEAHLKASFRALLKCSNADVDCHPLSSSVSEPNVSIRPT